MNTASNVSISRSTPRMQSSMSADADIVQYQSVSHLAVLTLILGIASVTALVHVMLWILPPLTLAVGWVALRRIAASGQSLTGRSLASLGILVACFFGAWAITKSAVTHRVVDREAREYTRLWLQLVHDGDQARIHQQNRLAGDRIHDAKRLAEFYKNSADAKLNLDKFLETEPLRSALQAGSTLTWTFTGVLEQISDKSDRYVMVPLRLEGTVDGQPWKQETRLSLHRSWANGECHWRILGFIDESGS